MILLRTAFGGPLGSGGLIDPDGFWQDLELGSTPWKSFGVEVVEGKLDLVALFKDLLGLAKMGGIRR